MPVCRVFTVYFETRFLDYCLPKCAAWYAASVKRGKIRIWCKTRQNVQLMSGAGKLVYHLPKDSGKYALKVNETRLFGRSSGKFPRATEHLER